MVPFESLDAVSYSLCIVTMALSCISFEIKPDIGRKSWFFSYPFAFDAPVRGSLSEYWHPVWYGKTRMVGLPDGEKNYMYNRLHTVTACDGHLDGQTSCHGIVRAMHTRRAVIIIIIIVNLLWLTLITLTGVRRRGIVCMLASWRENG